MYCWGWLGERNGKLALTVHALCVGPLEVNCYLAGCQAHKECAVIDPGDSAQMILAAVAERGWRITGILNTHGHADHTGANAGVKKATGAPILIHRLDAELAQSQWAREAASYLGLAPTPPPDTLLEDGSEIKVCACAALKTIHTPGHSPGGACFYHEGSLFSGDTLFRMSIGRGDLPGGNPQILLKSIKERLFPLPGGTEIYPGHGDPTTVDFEKEYNPFLLNTGWR